MKIKILTEQLDYKENKLDEILLITEATVKKEDNMLIIDYKENAEDPDDDINTRIRLTDNKLVMTKIGIVSSTIEFESGKRFNSIYSTGYGNFKMVITTKSVDYKINEDGTGYINLKYMIKIGESDSYINRLNITLYMD
jgi:uncharacterized beta-barrel protein YwiB (DUF1934 family)